MASRGNLLTVLDVMDLEPGAEALAYLRLRRLANRHGCHEDRCGHPDPAVHNADVDYLHQWLQACGLEPYDAPRRPLPGCEGPAKTAYERPGAR